MMLSGRDTLFEIIARNATRVAVAAVCFFLVAPLIIVLPLSFNSSPYFSFPITEYSLRWYQELFSSANWRRAAYNSIVVATATTLIATPLGTLAAIGLHRATFAYKGFIVALLLSPMIVPIIVSAVGIYFFMSSTNLAGTRLGLILAHTVLAAPFVVVTVTATLSGLDMTLIRAAQSLGAGPLTVFRHVTMPLIMPGVVAGALFAFVTSFDDVIVALFLTGPEQHTLPREMWKGIRQQINPVILSAASSLVFLSLVVLLLVEYARRRSARRRGLER